MAEPKPRVNVTIRRSPHFAGGYATSGVFIKEGTGPLRPGEVVSLSDSHATKLLRALRDELEVTEEEATVELDELGDTLRPLPRALEAVVNEPIE